MPKGGVVPKLSRLQDAVRYAILRGTWAMRLSSGGSFRPFSQQGNILLVAILVARNDVQRDPKRRCGYTLQLSSLSLPMGSAWHRPRIIQPSPIPITVYPDNGMLAVVSKPEHVSPAHRLRSVAASLSGGGRKKVVLLRVRHPRPMCLV